MTRATALGRCHGYLVVGSDGPCGAVETPIYEPECSEPDFLVLRVPGSPHPHFTVIPTALVRSVEGESETVVIDATRDDLLRLPDELPVTM